jgi:hypothetical protein
MMINNLNTSNNTIINRIELGYFGNIWVRQNILHKAGNSLPGHAHKFDHVSLLTRGTIEVEIDGHPPKQFTAPTFIVVRKEYKHKFTAITDDVMWYCVFALRDLDGEPIEELYDPVSHDPISLDLMSSSAVSDDYWEKAKLLDKKTTT